MTVRLVTHARWLIVVHAVWLVWTAAVLPPADRHDALLILACVTAAAALAAATCPARATLPWLACVTAWCLARALLVAFIGSPTLSGPGTEMRAAAGWLLWVPALAIVAAVSRTEALSRSEGRRCG